MGIDIVVSIVGVVAALVTTIFTGMSGVIWYFITKDANRVETAINNLSSTVSAATITLKGIEVELKGLKEFVHTENQEQWEIINKVKDEVIKLSRDQ